MTPRVPKPKTCALRKCLGLGCDREFKSDGPGNRKCPRCRKRLGDLSRMAIAGPTKLEGAK